MTADTSIRGRFALQRVTSIEWIVVDRSRDANDPSRTIACVYEVDEFEYDVLWLHDLGLPSKYMSPTDVLDDIHRGEARRRTRSRKPLPIPHWAPTRVSHQHAFPVPG